MDFKRPQSLPATFTSLSCFGTLSRSSSLSISSNHLYLVLPLFCHFCQWPGELCRSLQGTLGFSGSPCGHVRTCVTCWEVAVSRTCTRPPEFSCLPAGRDVLRDEPLAPLAASPWGLTEPTLMPSHWCHPSSTLRAGLVCQLLALLLSAFLCSCDALFLVLQGLVCRALFPSPFVPSTCVRCNCSFVFGWNTLICSLSPVSVLFSPLVLLFFSLFHPFFYFSLC